ncbi:MAG: hypothetical protein ABSA67_07490 [Candidatus Brocadiia bacterium]|jgi:hypothetical protein
MKRILILLHEHFKHEQYLIYRLREAWQKQGLHVSCVYGIRDRPEADLLIPHVDLTRTPPEYIEYIRSYPNAVNRNVVDISKRRISANLLRGDEDFRGPVIVKTDNNSEGGSEEFLYRCRHPHLAWLRGKASAVQAHLAGHRSTARSGLHEYPVYSSLAEVPAGVFRNRALVVEKFLPEREGDRYFVRVYVCLGSHTQSIRIADSKPFVKRPAARQVDEGLEVPEPVLDLRRRIGLDYGKIDYTIHEGQVAILDVSLTPGWSAGTELTARTVGILAGGIWSLLPNQGNT